MWSENTKKIRKKNVKEGLREVEGVELSAVVEKAWLFTAAHHQLRGGRGGLSLPTLSLPGLYCTVYNTIML
jgi:hypothetical protein